MSNSTYEKFGDVEVIDIIISGPKMEKPVDLTIDYSSLTIYEDLFSDCTTGTIVVSDSHGVFENLMGEEMVTLKFSTHIGSGFDIFQKTFYIYNVANGGTDGKFIMYEIHFSSVILQKNLQRQISTYLKGKGSDIVEEIYENFLGMDYPIDVEDTKYEREIVIPNWRALKAITYFANTSVRTWSTDDTETSLVFYEDANQFNFKSLHTLYEQTPEYEIFVNSTGDAREFGTPLVCSSYYVKNLFDQYKNIKAGSYGTRLTTINLINKQQNIIDSDYEGNRVANFEYNPQNYHKVVADNDKEIGTHGWGRYSNGYLRLMEDLAVVIVLPGNSNITVGHTCYFRPKTGYFMDFENSNYLLPEKWLVTKVKHSIIDGYYRTTVELNAPEWKN